MISSAFNLKLLLVLVPATRVVSNAAVLKFCRQGSTQYLLVVVVHSSMRYFVYNIAVSDFSVSLHPSVMKFSVNQ